MAIRSTDITWLRVIAYLLLLHVALILVMSLYVMPRRTGTMPNTGWLLATSIAQVALALGLYQYRKWAALACSAISLSLGLWFAVLTFAVAPMPWSLLGLVPAALMFLPLAVTVQLWGRLR